MIDVERFKEEWDKIDKKMSDIDLIPRLYGTGQIFVGYNIDDAGITYKTRTSYSGCSDDDFDVTVSYDELNEPLSYFEEKFAKEIHDEETRKAALRDKAEKRQKDKDLAELERLKAKYE